MSDCVTDARDRMKCRFTETVFYRCALEHGYGVRSEDKSRQLFALYTNHGYPGLPDWVRIWIAKVCDGHITPTISPEKVKVT